MTRLMITLTELVKSKRFHILALSQIKREAKQERRKPRLIGLKSSGGIEENVPLFCCLNRNIETKEATLDIVKSRSGQAGLAIPLNLQSWSVSLW